MSEAMDQLKTSVEGVSQALFEAWEQAGRMAAGTLEFVDEAHRHTWHGIGERLQDSVDAFESAAEKLQVAANACAAAGLALGQIAQDLLVSRISLHLSAASTNLADAETALREATEKVNDAYDAAEQVGQEGVMRAASDLSDELTDLTQDLVRHRARSEEEQAMAAGFTGRQLGNCCRVMAQEPRHHPNRQGQNRRNLRGSSSGHQEIRCTTAWVSQRRYQSQNARLGKRLPTWARPTTKRSYERSRLMSATGR